MTSITSRAIRISQHGGPEQLELVQALTRDWQPGDGRSLFLVGDPKQSIYRFRRADIALYERIKRHLTAAGAEVLQLTTSFRALPEIQASFPYDLLRDFVPIGFVGEQPIAIAVMVVIVVSSLLGRVRRAGCCDRGTVASEPPPAAGV